jgi:hypothetical protein
MADENSDQLDVEQDQDVDEQKSQMLGRMAQQVKKRKSKLKKKTERRIITWIATSGCSCCLPVVIFIMTIGIVTIATLYIMGYFDDGSTPSVIQIIKTPTPV